MIIIYLDVLKNTINLVCFRHVILFLDVLLINNHPHSLVLKQFHAQLFCLDQAWRKEGLCSIMIKKKRTGFLILWMNTMPFMKIL